MSKKWKKDVKFKSFMFSIITPKIEELLKRIKQF